MYQRFQHQDKIDWNCLSENPNAIHLLETNLTKIDWSTLSENTSTKKLYWEPRLNHILDMSNLYIILQKSLLPELALRILHLVEIYL